MKDPIEQHQAAAQENSTALLRLGTAAGASRQYAVYVMDTVRWCNEANVPFVYLDFDAWLQRTRHRLRQAQQYHAAQVEYLEGGQARALFGLERALKLWSTQQVLT
jgi:hypothetical protein